MNETILDYLIKALVLFTAVPVHECAHAWVAEKMGDDTNSFVKHDFFFSCTIFRCAEKDFFNSSSFINTSNYSNVQ